MINLLREQNLKLISEYEESNNHKLVTKHRIIEQLLKDDHCFEKLDIQKSYEILKSLGVKDWKEVYIQLLSK